jgi:hypothetical protein
MNAEVAVGFRAIRCAIRLKAREGTDARLLEKLRIASEQSCVVQQTLLHPRALKRNRFLSGVISF